MKKKLLSLALACGMVFSLAACGTPANNESPAPNTESPAIGTETPAADTPTYEPATVRVAYMPNLGSAGSLFVGIEQGYFEEVGLTVETFEFQGGPAEIAAMASGDIDISQIGHGAHKLCIQGEAKIFQMDHTTSLSDVVVGNKAKGIETIEDLKGKTVAVSSGTSSEIILEQALARAGMTMDDINTVEMTVDGMTTAMISGQIDAAASWSPNTVTLQNALGDNYVDLGTNADFLDSAIFPPATFVPLSTPRPTTTSWCVLPRPWTRLMTGALPIPRRWPSCWPRSWTPPRTPCWPQLARPTGRPSPRSAATWTPSRRSMRPSRAFSWIMAPLPRMFLWRTMCSLM